MCVWLRVCVYIYISCVFDCVCVYTIRFWNTTPVYTNKLDVDDYDLVD